MTPTEIEALKVKARAMGAPEDQIMAFIAKYGNADAGGLSQAPVASQSQLSISASPSNLTGGVSIDTANAPAAPVSAPAPAPVVDEEFKTGNGIVDALFQAPERLGDALGKATSLVTGGNDLFEKTQQQYMDTADRMTTQAELLRKQGKTKEADKFDAWAKESIELAQKNADTQLKDAKKGVKDTVKGGVGTAAMIVPSGGANLATKVATGAAQGAVAGYAASNDQNELSSAISGGAIGGAIPIAGDLIGKGAGKLKDLTSEAAQKATKILAEKSDDIALSTYTKELGKPTKAEGGKELLKRMSKIGIKAADADTVVEQANQVLRENGGLVYEATRELDSKGAKISVAKITESLEKQLDEAKSLVTKEPIQQVLDVIKNDLGDVTDISPSELYLLKSEYGGLGRWTSMSSAVEKKQAEIWRDVYIQANDLIDASLKENGFTDFKVINDKVHTAMQASQYAGRSGNVAPNKYNMGLYDWLATISGAVAGSPFAAVGSYAAKRAFESPASASVTSNILKRAANVVEKVGLPEVQANPALANLAKIAIENSIVSMGNNEGNQTNNNQGQNSSPHLSDPTELISVPQGNQTEQTAGNQSLNEQGQMKGIQNATYNNQNDPLHNTSLSKTTDSIPQPAPVKHIIPAFRNFNTKEEMMAYFFEKNSPPEAVERLGKMWDQFAPAQVDQAEISDQFLTTGKALTKADKVFALQNPDKIPGAGTATGTEAQRKLGPGVTRAFDQLEKIAAIGTKDTLFQGGSTTLGKAVKNTGIDARKATDEKFAQRVNQYNAQKTLIVGAISQIMGSGTPQEGEAQRLLDTIPGEYTSEADAKAWFENARTILGVK